MSFKETKIGRIPEEWEVNTMENSLEEIIDYRGKTPKKSDSGIITLSAKSVKNGYIDYSNVYYISKETYKKFMVKGFPKKGDILLTTEAPLGNVAKLDRNNIAIAQRLFTLRGKKNYLLDDYLRYYLMSYIGQSQLKLRETGTTVTGIKQSEFRKVLISIPPLQEQKAIAKIHSSLDEKIELNNRINKNLEEMAQVIFKHWFVDFEFPDENGRPYKSSGGEMIESELGMIPKGWEVLRIEEVLKFFIGGDWGNDKNEKFTEKIYCIRGADFPKLQHSIYTNIHIRYVKNNSFNKRKLQDGDIILEISGGTKGRPTGRTLYIHKNIANYYDNRLSFSNFCRLLRTNEILDSKILYLHLQMLYSSGVMETFQVQSTGISNFQFKNFISSKKIIIPNLKVQEEFVNIIDTLFTKKNNFENYILTSLRDTLLSKLMSGQIRVPVKK
jgi:type I restriction enzyme, S subunit